ncbi:MAG TPA: hypothetical protein VEK76_13300 [Candidatus Binatia bacterium]|nr:hypothetical protein [Candidatus Binatia bacterium]
MIDDAERLDAALNLRQIGAGLDRVPPALRALVDLAAEVGDACSQGVLTPADHDRIYADAVSRFEARRAGRVWLRIRGRRAAVIGGAAVVTAVAAAVGVGVLAGRWSHRLDLLRPSPA